jgi:signal transduction histidine kinase
MFSQLELALLAVAVVVDSVLLLVILERVNRRSTAIWLFAIVIATWLAHAAGFSHVLIRGSSAEPLVLLDRCNMAILAISLVVMPCAMLHAAVRLNHTAYDMRPPRDNRYALIYLPLGAVPWIVQRAATTTSREVTECFAPLVNTVESVSLRKFYLRLVGLLAAMTVMVVAYGLIGRGGWWDAPFKLAVICSPMSVVLLFLYYALREKLMPLVIERSLVYGASLIMILLVHQVFIVPIAESMQRRSNLDIILIEGIVLLGLILAWKPLRQRVLESTRYLLSQNIFKVRESVRQLSLQLSQQELRSLTELCQWFVRHVSTHLDVRDAWLWFSDDAVASPCLPDIDESIIKQLYQVLVESNKSSLDREAFRDKLLVSVLESRGIQYVFRCQFRELRGLVFLGQRDRGDRFTAEQRSALSILFDQFAATLHNRVVEQERLRAERQASQQEKLAVLGLMSGSLAHEIKNPLSSIRTIATLLREDLRDQEQAKDIDMILEEIDRLSQTTMRLLDYSKPADDTVVGIQIQPTIDRLFHILEPWARQQRVKLTLELSSEPVVVRATDASLSEVLFNLLRNAIEATRTREQGLVSVRSRREGAFLVVTVQDNGPGIDPSIRENIYRPFVTSKEYGTGLGLYIAADRVRSIGGKLECQSDAGSGTVFEVRLPIVKIDCQ